MPFALFRTSLPPASRTRRRSRHASRPVVEGLEARTVLSASTVSIGFDPGAHTAYSADHQAHANWRRFPLGTISGTVVGTDSGRGLAQVRVQLINAQGDVAAVTRTGARGRYAFPIWANGPYVVHEVTPRRFTQTSPTFNFTVPPTGSFAIDPTTGKPYGSKSWGWDTGNSDPANGPVGPYAWTNVAPAGNLPFQSPINIVTPPIDLSPYLQIHYTNSTPTEITNNGHELEVEFGNDNPSDTITIDGSVFHLAQFHFHDPSETNVDGHGYSMELHFVNFNDAGAASVVGVFLQLGAYNPTLQPLLDAATASLSTPGSTTPATAPINFADLLPSNLTGWFYQGSLTTPPLSQPVNWFVLATPITLDGAQLNQYEALARGSGFLTNNRPVQPLDGRQVNQFNFQVDFQTQSISGLTFDLARTPRPAQNHVAHHARASHPA
jgi:carbonic anhydrase